MKKLFWVLMVFLAGGCWSGGFYKLIQAPTNSVELAWNSRNLEKMPVALDVVLNGPNDMKLSQEDLFNQFSSLLFTTGFYSNISPRATTNERQLCLSLFSTNRLLTDSLLESKFDLSVVWAADRKKSYQAICKSEGRGRTTITMQQDAFRAQYRLCLTSLVNQIATDYAEMTGISGQQTDGFSKTSALGAVRVGDKKLEGAKSDCSQLYRVGSKDYGSCVMKLLD